MCQDEAERFSALLRSPQLPEEVWINPPVEQKLATATVRSAASEGRDASKPACSDWVSDACENPVSPQS
jgi:hypothetical protein